MKLLATDLDGTLLEEHVRVTKENQEAIKQLKEQGHMVVIATGRGFTDTAFLKEEFGIDYDYLVLLNGALLVDKDNKVVKQDVISYDICQKIYDRFQDVNCEMAYSTGFKYLFLKEKREDFPAFSEVIETVEELSTHTISLISIDFTGLEISEVQMLTDKINEECEDVVAYRNTTFVDVVPAGNSKGIAVSEVARQFNVSSEDIYTIGDSWNDVSMFEITDNAYTFDYAEKEIQEKVNHVVGSVHECVRNMLKVEKNKVL